MVKPSLPVDIYIRVSRVGGRENLISPTEQERRARQLATERGLKVGEVLTDLDESGGKWDRPGLQEALRRVREHESGGLIVAWLDRLSRDSEHAHRLVREIGEAGGAIYAPDAPDDFTSPEGELQAGMVFLFAQYVRKRSRKGFEDAKAQAIERGIPVNAWPPAGLRKREGDRRLEPIPEAAPVIHEVFERRAAGAGPFELAELLERGGVQTSRGSRSWSHASVYRLIANPVYKGHVRYGRDDRFVNTSGVEPIVDEVLWQAAQRSPRSLSPVSEKSETLLSGLLRCAACRYAMQGTMTTRRRAVYRCQGRHAAGRCPAPARIYADEAEKAVLDAFWSITEDVAASGSRSERSNTLAALKDVFDKAEGRVRQLQSAEAQDALGDAYFETFRARRAERDGAAEALGRARAEQASEQRRPESVETLRGAWERATTAQRRELLGHRIDCVAVSGSRNGERSLVVYRKGSAPDDLPRRGHPTGELRPFPDAPEGAREPVQS